MLINKQLYITLGIITIAIVLCRELLKLSFCQDNVLLFGNFLLFVITALADLLMKKGIQSETNAGFMNAFYGSFMIKFLVVAIAAFTYIYLTAKPNKMALLALFPIYCIYTFIELQGLKTLLENKKHA